MHYVPFPFFDRKSTLLRIGTHFTNDREFFGYAKRQTLFCHLDIFCSLRQAGTAFWIVNAVHPNSVFTTQVFEELERQTPTPHLTSLTV